MEQIAERICEKIAVINLSGDPLARTGLVHTLWSCRGTDVVEEEDPARADMIMLLAGVVTDEEITWLERAGRHSGRVRPVVLVADHITEGQVGRAVGCGLTGFLFRQAATPLRVGEVIDAARRGEPDFPDVLVGSLLRQIKAIRHTILEPVDHASRKLTTREVEVLKLVADGCNTQEVSDKLGYSERTIKGIIRGVVHRLRLKNRTHAVAFALRAGFI
ncbi:response regulator transcription factor [Streptomyces sp. NPDC060006]|uniref:response regulator transcription factor n=1 Tax=unclassified Streptomyces TaxID=2593676 RepID=UPI003629C1A4